MFLFLKGWSFSTLFLYNLLSPISIISIFAHNNKLINIVLMIKNKGYKLKEDASAGKNLNFKKGQEFEIVMDVVYMGGHPVQTSYQQTLLNWLKNNPTLFNDKKL